MKVGFILLVAITLGLSATQLLQTVSGTIAIPVLDATICQIILTLAALILIEQLFRNATRQQRQNIKYLGIALTSLLCIDLYGYAYTSVFGLADSTLQQARGSVNILIGTILLLGALRASPSQSLSISRTMTFYTTSIFLVGVFLLIMAAAGYYIRIRGGSWSGALQLVLLVFTFVALVSFAASRSTRANIRVFVSKHFFRHKYDYRTVWLELIQTLSATATDDDFYLRSITAATKVFDSPGGSLWLYNQDDAYEPVANWHMACPARLKEPKDSRFIDLLANKEWVFTPGATLTASDDPYANELPRWVAEFDDLWIIAPLKIGDELSGFFLLCKPQNSDRVIWEDLDVLKTVGRQLASYILRQRSAEQLAESKQFDTYNRLTAFIMHDLKNLIAQQALVVKNANKHKENPAFVEDAINTIDNSVQRMSHLLKRLQSSSEGTALRSVSLEKVLLETIRKSTDRQPIPTLRKSVDDVKILADRDQLVMVLMHVIRNAQDATESSGFIDIVFKMRGEQVLIDIEDNGCGMDEEFLKNRLFKPFESTKSSMGMGIGAYQVREFIQNMGGEIMVKSEPGAGTTVCIALPFMK